MISSYIYIFIGINIYKKNFVYSSILNLVHYLINSASNK